MKENTRLIIAIFCIAFIVRFLFLLIMPQFFDGMFGFRDDWIYLTYAKNIISQGIWVPDVTKMDLEIFGKPYNAHVVGPGWPLIISLIILLFGENIQLIMFINVILSSLTCIVIYYLGKEVFNKKIGIISSFWSIIYIYFLIYIPRILKESILQLLIPLVILLMVYEIKKVKLNMVTILFPLTFTFLIHTDERYLIFLPIIFIGLMACDNINMKNGLKKFAVFMTSVIVLSIPWTIRNYVVYNKIVVLTVRTERVINPILKKINNYNIIHNINGEIGKDLSKEYPDNERYEVFDRRLLSYSENGDYPLTFLDAVNEVFQRFKIYWAPMVLRESIYRGVTMSAGSLKYNFGGMFSFGIILPFFIIGSFICFKKNRLGTIMIFFILIQTILHVLPLQTLIMWPRYRYPIDSLIITIAFYGLYQLMHANLIKRQVSNIKSLFSILYGSRI